MKYLERFPTWDSFYMKMPSTFIEKYQTLTFYKQRYTSHIFIKLCNLALQMSWQ